MAIYFPVIPVVASALHFVGYNRPHRRPGRGVKSSHKIIVVKIYFLEMKVSRSVGILSKLKLYLLENASLKVDYFFMS